MLNTRLGIFVVVFVIVGISGMFDAYSGSNRKKVELNRKKATNKMKPENLRSEMEQRFFESGGTIREIDPNSEAELDLVAQRMRITLIEVLGEEVAARDANLDLRWLKARAKQHIDPDVYKGQIFLSISSDGQITGHTIVRVDVDKEIDGGTPYGYFSTTYVDPNFRNVGTAVSLVKTGEKWMKEHKMKRSITNTDVNNVKLQNLFRKLGYSITDRNEKFVQLSKDL